MSTHLHLIQRAITGTAAVNGELWECGVFRGDTAVWMRRYADPKRTLHLFDTFSGLPMSGVHDTHPAGSMAGTSADLVRGRFYEDAYTHIHPGVMPATFAGLEDSCISVVNIDVDQYQSVKDCLEFIYPRMAKGGFVILDDYNCPDCPGAKLAVDEFMVDKPEQLVLEGEHQPHFIKL